MPSPSIDISLTILFLEKRRKYDYLEISHEYRVLDCFFFAPFYLTVEGINSLWQQVQTSCPYSPTQLNLNSALTF